MAQRARRSLMPVCSPKSWLPHLPHLEISSSHSKDCVSGGRSASHGRNVFDACCSLGDDAWRSRYPGMTPAGSPFSGVLPIEVLTKMLDKRKVEVCAIVVGLLLFSSFAARVRRDPVPRKLDDQIASLHHKRHRHCRFQLFLL